MIAAWPVGDEGARLARHARASRSRTRPSRSPAATRSCSTSSWRGSAAPTCTATAGIPGRGCRRSCSGTRSSGASTATRYAVYPLIGCGECEHCLAGEDNLCASWRLIGMHRAGRLRRAGRGAAASRSCRCRTGSTTSARCWSSRSPAASARSRRTATRSSSRVLGCGPLGLLTRLPRARARGAHVTASIRSPSGARSPSGSARPTRRPSSTPGDFDLVVDAAGFEADLARRRSRAFAPAARSSCSGSATPRRRSRWPSLVRRAMTLRGQFAYTRAEFARALEVLAEGDLVARLALDRPARRRRRRVREPRRPARRVREGRARAVTPELVTIRHLRGSAPR